MTKLGTGISAMAAYSKVTQQVSSEGIRNQADIVISVGNYSVF